jgi:Flp pilus assembly pilin Flp
MTWTQFGSIAKRSVRRLARDERGTEVVETALILGLLCLVALGVMAQLGSKILTRWSLIFDAL